MFVESIMATFLYVFILILFISYVLVLFIFTLSLGSALPLLATSGGTGELTAGLKK